MNSRIDPSSLPAGVIGAGLMGTSIAACLLSAGHRVVAVESNGDRRRTARLRVLGLLRESQRQGLGAAGAERAVDRYRVLPEVSALSGAALVIESITENLAAKRSLIRNVEDIVGRETLIGSNTSAIPIKNTP